MSANDAALPLAPALRLPSIRVRLSHVLLVLALAWGAVVAATVGLTVRAEVDELLDDSLQASATVLAGVLQTWPESAPALPAQLAQPPLPASARFAWQLLAIDATVMQRSAQAPEWPLSPPGRGGFHDAEPDWRVFSLVLPAGPTLLVAQSRSERLEARTEVVWGAALAALAVSLVSVPLLRWQVRRELRPLAALRDALDGYEPLQAACRLPAATREELAPIHAAIDQLGQRLALRVAGERAFSAQAAHALRTPLAGIDAQLAMVLRSAPPELRPRLAKTRLAAARLAHVVSALLALFRSGNELQRGPLDVAALLAWLHFDGLAIDVQGPPLASADADLLAATLLNLLDNAQRHGGKTVHITTEPERLSLHDDGPGIDAVRRQALNLALAAARGVVEGRLQPKTAAASADAVNGTAAKEAPDVQTELGLGLGLLLADRVARAHGGELSFPAAASGFTVSFSLPVPEPRSP